MNIDIENIAKKAINQFVHYSCAFLIPGSETSPVTDVGSGIIIETKKNHLCILTAEHVAEDAKRHEYRLGYYKCSNQIVDFVHGVILCSNNIDVGLLIIKDQYIPQLKHLAIKFDRVPKKQQGIDEGHLILCGFPGEMTRYNQKENYVGFTVLTYWCEPDNVIFDKKGRYNIKWNDAFDSDGNDIILPSPGGMSGGPLWSFAKPSSDSIWNPHEIGKIIGIQSAWDEKNHTTFIYPVSKWGEWFHESIGAVDQDLDTHLHF
jgi:hypothetical protein